MATFLNGRYTGEDCSVVMVVVRKGRDPPGLPEVDLVDLGSNLAGIPSPPVQKVVPLTKEEIV